MLKAFGYRARWCHTGVAALVLLFVAAAYIPATWHEGHTADKDCTVCKIDHHKLIDLPVTTSLTPTVVPDEAAPALDVGPAAVVVSYQAPPRAPPV